jgi:hypothetical protein
MIRRALLFTTLALLSGCTFTEEPPVGRAPLKPEAEAPADPIDALVASLAKTGGMWLNGISPVLELPEDAPFEDLVAEFFQKVSYEGGPIGSIAIEEIRPVSIPPGFDSDRYTAVLVHTNLGRKILLLQFQKSDRWWCRVYDAQGL